MPCARGESGPILELGHGAPLVLVNESFGQTLTIPAARSGPFRFKLPTLKQYRALHLLGLERRARYKIVGVGADELDDGLDKADKSPRSSALFALHVMPHAILAKASGEPQAIRTASASNRFPLPAIIKHTAARRSVTWIKREPGDGAWDGWCRFS